MGRQVVRHFDHSIGSNALLDVFDLCRAAECSIRNCTINIFTFTRSENVSEQDSSRVILSTMNFRQLNAVA